MKLPSAPWNQSNSLKQLIAALDPSNEKIRFVGGAVRDTLLGIPVRDIDLATSLEPGEVIALLKAAAIKAIPTGIDHGTITAVTQDGPVEITTLRRDVSTDGRRATVRFTSDWKEDAARRDFTINALSADPETLEVFDYFNGLADLEARQIRFIGSAADRIAEDHLRIMRYFRFLARFGQDRVEHEAYGACIAAAASLKSLSRERIADELMKLLGTENPAFAVGKMLDAGIFGHIFSETDGNASAILERLLERERECDIPPFALRRLVALLPKDGDKALKIVTLLRFSKKMRRAVTDRLAEAQPDPQNILALAYRHGAQAASDMILLFANDQDVAASLSKLQDWEKPVLPLTGGDLVTMGLQRGPIVAETLSKVEEAWIKKGFPGEGEALELARLLVREASAR
ncbi:CCA tRNA nucleotidyltransferase [Parasphingorhabdus sp.]|uniref:CCA tRNA nucleotidyltransferase n=1 Tax=Parasphingorhabdus sp. TaxID=2709688 RepID=UPI0032661272